MRRQSTTAFLNETENGKQVDCRLVLAMERQPSITETNDADEHGAGRGNESVGGEGNRKTRRSDAEGVTDAIASNGWIERTGGSASCFVENDCDDGVRRRRRQQKCYSTAAGIL